MEQLGRGRRADFDQSTDERLREVLEWLNLSSEEIKPLLTSPPSSEDEGASPVFQSTLSSPKTPKPAPLSPPGAAAGPHPSTRGRWKKILRILNTNNYLRQKLWRRRRRRSSQKKKKLEQNKKAKFPRPSTINC
jgi:hypothetical protein